MAIICSHCFIFCLQLAANRGSFKLPLQASFLLFALAVHHNPRLHKLDSAQSGHRTPPMVQNCSCACGGKGKDQSQRRVVLQRAITWDTARSNFQELTGCIWACVKTGVHRNYNFNGENDDEAWDFVSALFWGCLLWIYVNLGGSALYPRREVRWSSKLGHKQLLPDAVPQELATSLSWCWTPLLAGSQLIRPTGQ